MNELPEFLERAMTVATYQASIVAKHSLLQVLFSTVTESRAKYLALKDEVGRWTQADWLDLPRNESRRALYAERDAHKTSFEDAAAALVLIAAAAIERLYKALQDSVFDRGVESYVPSIRFSRALWVLANQYKHLGEWVHGSKVAKERSEVEALVGNPLRTDAAAEFLTRSAFRSYDEFEAALLSCVGGIAGPGILPTGESGIVSVTIRSGFQEP